MEEAKQMMSQCVIALACARVSMYKAHVQGGKHGKEVHVSESLYKHIPEELGWGIRVQLFRQKVYK